MRIIARSTLEQRYADAKHNEDNVPDINRHCWIEGEPEAEGTQIWVLMIADPEQDSSKQEQRSQNWQCPGFLSGRVERNYCNGDKVGRKLLKGVQDKARVDVQSGIGFGHSPYPHRGIEPLGRDYANADDAGQQREGCALEDECDFISRRGPLRGHPMPYEFDAEKEPKCKDPISNQHKKEGPLTRGEAEIFGARVASIPLNPSWTKVPFDWSAPASPDAQRTVHAVVTGYYAEQPALPMNTYKPLGRGLCLVGIDASDRDAPQALFGLL
jgi:hypothetical protein